MKEYGAVIEDLLGKTFKRVVGSKESVVFYVSETEYYEMYHIQDCCEEVHLEDVVGELEWLVDSPILMAEEVSNQNDTASGSETWTYYKLATQKGYVTLRWYGESSGYYAEDVDMRLCIEEDGDWD